MTLLALPLCTAAAVWGIVSPKTLTAACDQLIDTTFEAAGSVVMWAVTAFVVLLVGLAVSRVGRLRLGNADDRPEFSTLSWLAMLFAAGMGVGLLFWGVAEPISHFANPPAGAAFSAESMRRAMVLTSFHWGLHAWAVYAVAALVLAYFGFRRGQPALPSAPLRATFKGRWVKPVAGFADLLAIVAVAFGVAGSLAMGVLQLHGGLAASTAIPAKSTLVPILILAALTIAYLLSAATSLDKGIKWLSNINMALAVILLVLVFAFGPTLELLGGFFRSLGDYVSALPLLQTETLGYTADRWVQKWTLTYFVWWIAWAPFVGIFIARISRGRTIRQFVAGVLLVPTVFSVLWFAVLGGTGVHEQLHGGGQLAAMVAKDVTAALFALFDTLPLSGLLSALALTLVFVFLVTSADSATYVLGMLSSRGALDPSRKIKIAWGIGIAVLAAALALSHSIDVVRAITITGALPFTVVLILQVLAMLAAMVRDPELRRSRYAEEQCPSSDSSYSSSSPARSS
ncbi:MAG: BCCT family transporter [Myxococcales bacterium]|nr:BCCT family transporter [Myxococcales bacterium]